MSTVLLCDHQVLIISERLYGKFRTNIEGKLKRASPHTHLYMTILRLCLYLLFSSFLVFSRSSPFSKLNKIKNDNKDSFIGSSLAFS